MFVDDKLLDKLEKLAMIHIAQEKREDFKEELSEIIAKMDSLQEVDTDSIALQKDDKTPMRPDLPEDSAIRDQILKQAPKAKDGYFIVPKVIG
ncbi:glutamyl-tRNA amidotransferase [Helicobacter bilis]|uniref:Aspartyl/glutamyl-tRNA(Asn/Gln) amidotransferase subunit C n=2 Tax=Helicobacter bilis TaxID=37372 RepID=C3XFW1_9HELI|nr:MULTISPECIES: Asp-tRNA(Asn)/Glu-tRNA(Gln) amidotransferase subunit GatC [Helicobacter]AQQ59026.1 glutamyl-tRNA amidotransferase [Helicobacter bilis]EEO23900.1 aspartyl/glutamyl-tRNA(Asn/Gln) amidotransferase, C subunit [Helicobacter bilis ATCC 43879]MDY5950551.1 Asp-tRNA(Asn)/Glu-tRNA(Gln) amidotransferase subunit GatC [Helicobacter sp.]